MYKILVRTGRLEAIAKKTMLKFGNFSLFRKKTTEK